MPGSGSRAKVVFWGFAIFFVQGHGIHLSANSIGNLLKEKTSDVYRLTYFYDERLGHYLWTFGLVGLWSVIVAANARGSAYCLSGRARLATLVAALVYGFNYFVGTVEAQTTPIGIPYAVAVSLVVLLLRKRTGPLWGNPVLAFTLIAYLFSALLFLGWGVYWRGMPEFSAVGIL